MTETEIERVKSLCDRYSEQTKIIVYLRNQVDFLVSAFGTAIRGGSTRKFPFPLNKRQIRTMDHLALLEPWRKIFGRENMIVRRFEPEDFPAGDLLADFSSVVPFDISGFRRGKRQNESISALALAFLRELNKHVPALLGGEENPARKGIIGALRRAELGA